MSKHIAWLDSSLYQWRRSDFRVCVCVGGGGGQKCSTVHLFHIKHDYLVGVTCPQPLPPPPPLRSYDPVVDYNTLVKQRSYTKELKNYENRQNVTENMKCVCVWMCACVSV